MRVIISFGLCLPLSHLWKSLFSELTGVESSKLRPSGCHVNMRERARECACACVRVRVCVCVCGCMCVSQMRGTVVSACLRVCACVCGRASVPAGVCLRPCVCVCVRAFLRECVHTYNCISSSHTCITW